MTADAAERSLDGRTILVTGATGFIGDHTCARLAMLGATVRRASRRAGDDTVCVGQIDGSTDWSRGLEGADAVVHLAARVHVHQERSADALAEFRRVNVDGTRRLAASAAGAGIRRLVLLSTVGVHGQESAKILDETSPTEPANPYSRSKLEAEAALLEVAAASDLETVIVRAPLVYGANDPGNLPRLIRLVASGMPLPLGSARSARSYLYVGNLADLLARCLTHRRAVGEVFLAADGVDLTTAELARRLGAAMGRRPLLLPVPRWLLTAGARAIGRSADVSRLFGSLTIDVRKARETLGWRPPFTVDEGLAVAVEATTRAAARERSDIS